LTSEKKHLHPYQAIFSAAIKLSTKDRAKGVLMEFLNSQSFQLLGGEKVPRFIMH
jgi:hypothetical protein